MSALAAAVLLAAVTMGWFSLALLPALLELWRRTDTEPLQLRRGGGDVRYFALGFQRFVDDELAALGDGRARHPSTGTAVRLRRGEPAWHIPSRRHFATLPVEHMPEGALTSHVVLCEEELVVPEQTSLLKELYVARELRGGTDCFYRAVLTRGDARLGARSGVLRWIDAGGLLVAGESSVLHGRASAAHVMRLEDGVKFERVAAPTIVFGTPDASRRAMQGAGPRAGRGMDDQSTTPTVPADFEPPAHVTQSFGRWLIDGDLDVPPGALVHVALVVTGTLRIGAGARIAGGIKSGVLVGAPGAVYDGAIVATERMELGDGSIVAGPIVVEGDAWLGADSRVGTVAEPTTISVVSVRIGRGTVVCGEVWARTAGEVEGAAVRRALSSGGFEAVS